MTPYNHPIHMCTWVNECTVTCLYEYICTNIGTIPDVDMCAFVTWSKLQIANLRTCLPMHVYVNMHTKEKIYYLCV